jgi:hypothetical protein
MRFLQEDGSSREDSFKEECWDCRYFLMKPAKDKHKHDCIMAMCAWQRLNWQAPTASAGKRICREET